MFLYKFDDTGHEAGLPDDCAAIGAIRRKRRQENPVANSTKMFCRYLYSSRYTGIHKIRPKCF